MDNCDPTEIEKFNQLADKWWDHNGELKTLHDINPTRIAFIKKYADIKQKKILDIGCGGGILSEALATEAKKVVGIDLSQECINIAIEHGKSHENLSYQVIEVEAFAKKNPEEFDVVTCFEMLEHVPEPERIIEAAKKITAKNGDLFFSTLNRHPKAFFTAILGAEYILNIIPRGTHQYRDFIKPSELANWAIKNDLSIKEISGLHYNPWKRKSWINKDINVNYIVHCTK